METAAHQYWMWMKRREILMKSSSFGDSPTSSTWEERAFAEDANGSLNGGGCVWPPRSYSCSFCKREFRSAQALGGHMNVHRRDRARLKHTLSLQNNSLNSSFDPKNHDHIPSHHHEAAACTATSATLNSPSRVSGLSTQENLSDHHHTFVVSSNYMMTNKFLNISSPSSVSKPNSQTLLEKNIPKEEESIISIRVRDDDDDDDELVETNLCVGLKPSTGRSCEDQETTINSCKRTKTAAVSTLPFLVSNDHNNSKYRHHHHHLQMEVLGFRSAGSKENNLDLELRLGDPPKVK